MLNEYMRSDTPINEDIFRRSLGYVEHAIYKPSISEKIVMAWTDHIQIYLSDYKVWCDLLSCNKIGIVLAS